MKLKKSLNVFYVLDIRFLIPFTVSLTSLIENNKDINLSVYLIHNLKDSKLLERIILYFSEKFSIKLNLNFFSDTILKDLPTPEYISKAAYYRLFLADILPESVCSGLYIDCDTVVTGSLNGLIDKYSVSDHFLLAVEDRYGNNDMERLNKMGVKTEFYFNSGVLLINLEKWRSENVTEMLMQVADKYINDLKWCDQDVLNIFFSGKCCRIEETYNTITDKKLPETPIIIHFSGASKPWHYINSGPYKSFYLKFLKMTPFKNEVFEQISAKKVLRKYLNKFKRSLQITSFAELFFLKVQKFKK
jgi:lipopolysaccharide biosynthesis glycosyltransferase